MKYFRSLALSCCLLFSLFGCVTPETIRPELRFDYPDFGHKETTIEYTSDTPFTCTPGLFGHHIVYSAHIAGSPVERHFISWIFNTHLKITTERGGWQQPAWIDKNDDQVIDSYSRDVTTLVGYPNPCEMVKHIS